jgi:polyhydroxyalkanoate synthase
MNRSDGRTDSVTDAKCAVQQRHAPRPLPLFLELVRMISEEEPDLAAKALEGLARYEHAPRPNGRCQRPAVAHAADSCLRDCGGSGAPVVLVPSLINPPDVLDLDERVSLTEAIAAMGRHALLLDWGPARSRSQLDLGGHVEKLLLPLLRQLPRPPALIGYCLGGTMAVAAANLIETERVALLAAPWKFAGYPQESRQSLLSVWNSAKDTARKLGALPMEVLQSAFWSLDPERTVSKFADLADADDEAAARFVTLEDWANEGEPLPYPAARELIEDLFERDLPGSGDWKVGEKSMSAHLDSPLLNVTALSDRITPAATASDGMTLSIDAGHVGMIVGSARHQLHSALAEFLGASCR